MACRPSFSGAAVKPGSITESVICVVLPNQACVIPGNGLIDIILRVSLGNEEGFILFPETVAQQPHFLKVSSEMLKMWQCRMKCLS